MRWPDGQTRDTQLWLDPGDSGKPRLRSLATPPYQIGRMVAAMLLLPDPRRDRRELGSGWPVERHQKYIVARIGFGPDTSFASPPESVEFEPNYIDASNRDSQHLIGVEARWNRLTALYNSSDGLNDELRQLIDDHRATLATGDPITNALNQQVGRLLIRLGAADANYTFGDDPLPNLERLVGLTPDEGPSLPPPDEIGEDEIDVRTRAAQEYRRAKARGPGARRFSVAVRSAYGHRCAFCGIVLGGVEGIVPGVDAAHILAWSSYDLDVIGNGIALCKLHHWAFDAALMVPVMEKGEYVVRFTHLADKLEPASRSMLGAEGFVIPDAWLPMEPAQRPSTKYLKRLYEDLEIEF